MIRSLVLAVVLAGLAPARAAGAPEDGGGRDEAARLVFLLQYVGTDYSSAVRDGSIVDEDEYREMREFAAVALERLERVGAYLPSEREREIRRVVEELRVDVEARRPGSAIRQRAERAVALLVSAFELTPEPPALPRPERAASLYRENCVDCHGEGGRGDGPRAKDLDPPPAAFTDRRRMDSVSPFVFYNAITYGVPGTAMASFQEALSAQERWDLAFFLWTFVAPEERSLPAERPTVPLRDLAALSSEELAPRLVAEAARRGVALGAKEARDLVAALRSRPTSSESPWERLSRVQDRLERGIAAIESGRLEEGVELVTDAYLHDFEPVEPTLEATRPDLRRRFEEELVALRRAARARDAGDARQSALRLLALAREAQEAVRGNASRTATFALIGGFAILLAAGLVAIGRHRR